MSTSVNRKKCSLVRNRAAYFFRTMGVCGFVKFVCLLFVRLILNGTRTESNIQLKSFLNLDVYLLAAPVQQKTGKSFCTSRRGARVLQLHMYFTMGEKYSSEQHVKHLSQRLVQREASKKVGII